MFLHDPAVDMDTVVPIAVVIRLARGCTNLHSRVAVQPPQPKMTLAPSVRCVRLYAARDAAALRAVAALRSTRKRVAVLSRPVKMELAESVRLVRLWAILDQADGLPLLGQFGAASPTPAGVVLPAKP